MARISSESKGSYYATPEKEIRLIAKRLRVEGEGFVSILDPCCGKGIALKHIADELNSQQTSCFSYGVELESERANAARMLLDHVIHDGYENMRTEAKFSLLWLNPPYTDGFGERTESIFLRRLTNASTNVLIRDGLLAFCIPQYVLADSAALLASRFSNIEVYRFTDDHYPQFKQVVVFGTFGKMKGEEQKATAKYLKELAAGGPELLPPLDEPDDVRFHVPVCTEPVQIFRAGRLHVEEVARDLLESPLFTQAEGMFEPDQSRKLELKNPMLPLKPTHFATAIAAGVVGGNLGTHLLVGITKQIIETSSQFDEQGKQTGEIVTKHYKSMVRVFTPGGVFDLS
ncbi:DUF6094 domain-containing protein [Brevibacillus dissolubilis]|uniref:DUF6094 domain-containing protein n=1 Tax=Brevibacillus dissolubilis TaxID=1844116 RepID=UPI00111706BB|nr:DUF6094 domain-containing protein [Brevibacillus dissolubilis]